VKGRLGKIASAIAGAAIVGVEHGKAMLGEKFVEEEAVAPAVCHRLRAGASVGIHDQGH
jgi:hypothetical protein